MGFRTIGRPLGWARPARAGSVALGATALSDLASAIGVHSEEAALVAELKAGSEEAYAWLVAQYHQPVYSLVYRMLGDSADAADTAQEVFLKVFRGMRSFNGQASLKTWIYRIAVNEAYNHRRWFSRHVRQEVALATDDATPAHADTFADPGRSPFEEAADHETRALVEAALEKLKPNFRAAVVLRDIEDLSYEEIASVLDVSLGTVKSRILRGREALRRILDGRLEPETRVNWSPQPQVE